MTASKIELRVLSVLKSVSDRDYQRQFQTKESAFSRPSVQKMTFEEAALFMVANSGKSLSIELLDFFNSIPDVRDTISKQAFSKQRQFVKSEVFEDLNYQYLQASYQEQKIRYHGMLLVAVDGSTAEIPNTKLMKDYFGSAKASSTSASNARVGLNGFYDPLNHAMLKLVVDKYQKNETQVFLENVDALISAYPEESFCFLFDRGYISLGLLFELDRRNVKYLFRVPSSCYKKELQSAESVDTTIAIKVTKARLKKVSPEKQLEYLKSPTKQVRLVQIELDSGEVEYLITNIPAEVVPYEEMKTFYFQRWEIERVFNVLKNRLHIENISARTPIGVRQDIQATVFLGNIIETIVTEANQKLPQKEKNKYEYCINVNMLCGVVKNYFLFFLYNTTLSEEEREIHYRRLVSFLKQTVIANKKGKTNPRIKKVSRNKHKTNIRSNY